MSTSIPASPSVLRRFWQNLFTYNWIFGLVLVILVGVPRFVIVLQANTNGNYKPVSLIFVFMWFAPFIFLNKSGRRGIGIRKPEQNHWLFYSFIAGIVFCSITFLIAELFFKDTVSNWFVYISRSYTANGKAFNGSEKNIYFIIYAITAMTFSPIGEELFYRGLVHGSFAKNGDEQKASRADSLAFALTHLAHFGIVYISGSWQFLLLPSLLWVLFMYLTSRIFFYCKQKTGSILGAIFSHAGFNLAMMYFIFYHIF